MPNSKAYKRSNEPITVIEQVPFALVRILNNLSTASKYLNDHESLNEDIEIASNEALQGYRTCDALLKFIVGCDLASLELTDHQKQGIELILRKPEWATYLLQACNEHQEECAGASL